MNIKDLSNTEYAPYQENYMKLVDSTWSLTEELEVSLHNFIRFVREIPMDKFDYRYADGKWTIKDIIQHLIDTERIFAYRALRFSRNDFIELPGFDENMYADNAYGNSRHLQSLLDELALVRQCSIALYKSLSNEDLLKGGQASGYYISVRALGFAIIGHQNHHMKIYKERYL